MSDNLVGLSTCDLALKPPKTTIQSIQVLAWRSSTWSKISEKHPGELGNPTIRLGLDGKWMGAVRAKSYLSFEVDPGERHLCASWQSHLKRLSKLASFAHFSSEADKTYYFPARITYSSYGAGAANMNLDLEPVDPDEGKFLIATNTMSQSRPNR